jgi:tetratricopeptide (TPR) repeat protein
MKSKQIKHTFITIAVFICGFTAVYFLSGFLEKNRPALPESFADEDLAVQGARLKGYSLGFEGLIADWYWMKSLQYLGDKILKNPDAKISLDNLTSLNPRLLYPYLNNATTLDPRFISVYEYGAVVLPAIDKDQAIKLLAKGIADNPNEWRLRQHLGYIYWRLGNYEKAAETYADGARIANAPRFMLMMAANMKSEGGSRDTARAIYRQMFEDAQDEQARENAKLRLLQLDSLDEQDAIRPVLQNFLAQTRSCANDWREVFPLVRKIRLPNGGSVRVDAKTLAPVDPTDAPYILNNREPGKCDLHLNFAESKIPAQ